MQEHIKIANTPPRIQYVGDGDQREFFFPFAIFKPEHVEVFLDGARYAGGMSVAGAGESAGGAVTLDEAPGEGVLVTLRRRIAVERTTDFQPAGAFSARLINDELDYLTAALQQVAADAETSLRLAATEPVVDMTLPPPTARAGGVLAFADDGRPAVEGREALAASIRHARLRGLDGDDHPGYLTAARADAWMATKSLDDLRDGFAAKRYTTQEKSKLAGLPADAEANPPRISEAEKLSASEWEPRTFSPRDVADLARRFASAGAGGGSGVSAHAMLVGLSADDHLHYLTAARADAWFPAKLAGSGTAETAARADHTHAGVYEPLIAVKNSAFNVDFGTGSGNAARGSHSHTATSISGGSLSRSVLPLFVGDSGSGGSVGAVPAPPAGAAAAGKVLAADGTWKGAGVGKGAAFPASPAAGEAFYRTDLGALFVYDGVRAKWLGELESGGAGKSGSHSAGYLAGEAGAVMSGTVGILLPYDVTVVGVSVVWGTAASGNVNVVRSGVIQQALPFTSATSFSAVDLDIDAGAGGILAFSTSGHAGAMTSPQLRCWWRRRAT